MELRLLEQYVAVAETLHFGRAAQRLHMSQPPLSVAIQRLEAEVGVPLLIRNRRGVRLTSAGEVFLAESRQVLASALQAVEATRRAARGESGVLRLGCMGPAISAGLFDIVQGFRVVCPDVRVSLEEQISARQIQLLRERALDVAVVRLYGTCPLEVHTRLFYRDTYIAAVPAKHRLADVSEISLKQLQEDTFIFYPRSMGAELYDALIAACHAEGFSPRIEQEVATKSTTLALVAAGAGVAFVPSSLVRAGYHGVRFLPLRALLPPVDIFWAWGKDYTNPLVERFLSYALAHKTEKRNFCHSDFFT